MTVSEKLNEFYIHNNLDKNGGENNPFFYLKFRFFSLKLPNSDFRKKAVYIHDIQHILFDCDVTWKGEGFIAGWEIATKIWKHFPLGIMSLWAMGFSFFNYPKEVLRGYKMGLKYKGIIDTPIAKEKILSMPVNEVNNLILKDVPSKFNWFYYSFWVLVSTIIFLVPLLFILLLWLLF